jgi:hypothetical protein
MEDSSKKKEKSSKKKEKSSKKKVDLKKSVNKNTDYKIGSVPLGFDENSILYIEDNKIYIKNK